MTRIVIVLDSGKTEELPREWQQVIRAARLIGYGEMKIVLHQGKPASAERITQKIKFGEEFDDNLFAVLD